MPPVLKVNSVLSNMEEQSLALLNLTALYLKMQISTLKSMNLQFQRTLAFEHYAILFSHWVFCLFITKEVVKVYEANK